MKNFNLLLILCLSFLVVSCADDEEMTGDGTGSETIVGTWKAESFEAQGDITNSVNIGPVSQEITTSFDFTGKDLDYTVTLEESPTTFTTSGSYGISGSVTTNGMSTTLDDSYENVSGAGSYRIEGDSLFTDGTLFDLELNGEPIALSQDETASKVEFEGDNKMIISQDVTTVDSSIPGTVLTTSLVSRSVWNRQ